MEINAVYIEIVFEVRYCVINFRVAVGRRLCINIIGLYLRTIYISAHITRVEKNLERQRI